MPFITNIELEFLFYYIMLWVLPYVLGSGFSYQPLLIFTLPKYFFLIYLPSPSLLVYLGKSAVIHSVISVYIHVAAFLFSHNSLNA